VPVRLPSHFPSTCWLLINPIYRIPVKGGRAELVVAPDNIRLKDTLSTWFTLTPDDQPLLLRDNSAEEIYSLNIANR